MILCSVHPGNLKPSAKGKARKASPTLRTSVLIVAQCGERHKDLAARDASSFWAFWPSPATLPYRDGAHGWGWAARELARWAS
jgi:hypothetical protein